MRRAQRAIVPILTAMIAVILPGLSACRLQKTGEPPGSAGARGASYPMEYAAGSFDDRFGISREAFLRTADEAAAVWETAARRDLFRFDTGAAFTVNLVYDERQERTVEARKVKAAIDSRGRSYDALIWQHARRMERWKEAETRYDAAAAELGKRFENHNAAVESWNDRGGAPEEEIARLDKERMELMRGEEELERLRTDLNDEVAAVNDLVTQINELAAANNIEVMYYNGRFVESREFEQGVFDGSAITIYQFSGIPDLRLALIHEFGHALGFGHVEDPSAVMHYRMGKQDLDKPALANSDLELLRKMLAQE